MKRTPLKRSTVPIKKVSDKRAAKIASGEIPKYPKRTPIAKSNKPIRTVKTTDKDYKGLLAKLDRVFSRFIRLRETDKNGNVMCFVTGRVLPWEKMQCGHYISRSHMATRFDEDNCHCQSPASNSLHEENIEPYKQALTLWGGISVVAYLEEMGRRVVKFSAQDLRDKIQYYEQELEKLKQ